MKLTRMGMNGIAVIAGFALTTIMTHSSFAQCEAYLARASDQLRDHYLGNSVAADGDIVVVGAPSAFGLSGAVYVYRVNGFVWSEEAKLVASDGAAQDQFGSSVDVQGDVIVVGAFSNTNAGFSTGSAYVFRFNGISWLEEQKLLASDIMPGARFGASIAVDSTAVGNTRIIVGAPGDDEAGFSAGAAYVFTFGGGTWNEETKVMASDAAPFDELGKSVDIQGDLALVGAFGKMSFNGGAYLLDRSSGSWVESQILSPSLAGPLGYGSSASIDGDRFLVGAPLNDAGFVFLYEMVGGGVAETVFAGSDGSSADFYGASVAIKGDSFVVGAPGGDDFGPISGSTYTYAFNGIDWDEDKLVPSASSATDRFGYAVTITDSWTVSTSPWDDPSNTRNAGTASIFDRQGVRALFAEYGDGWPGSNGVPDISISSPPVIGDTVGVVIQNSRFPAGTQGFLLLGATAISQDTPLDGTLLVSPFIITPLSFQANLPSLLLLTDIPNNPALIGIQIFIQVLQLDPNATKGVSFTKGIEAVIGLCAG